MKNSIKLLALGTALYLSSGLFGYSIKENTGQFVIREETGSVIKVKSISEKVEAILDNSINKILSGTDSYQQVLKNTVDQLMKEGQSTIANEVQQVLTRSGMDAKAEILCGLDFVREQLAGSLREIKRSQKFTPKPAICTVDPKVIELEEKEGQLRPKRQDLLASGYNFDGLIKVYLINKNNTQKDVTFSLAKPTRYNLSLNLGRNGVPFSRNSQLIKFALPGKTQTINIIQPFSEKHSQVVIMRGKISMKDAGLRSRSRTVNIDQTFVLTPSSQKKNFSDYWCVGEGRKIRGLLDVQFSLNPNTGAVDVEGVTKYFEGRGSCSEVSTLRKSNTFQYAIVDDTSRGYNHKLSDGRDYVDFALTFSNRSK